jgi:hypothetical protein
MNYDSVFIHIPRTGGVCLKWALNAKIQNLDYMNSHDHSPARARKLLLGDAIWNRIYKFTIVRNPWDRTVSLYHHHKTNLSFEDWLKTTNVNQTDFFQDDNVDLVNDVFQYEFYIESIPIICERAGWPPLQLIKVNASIRDSDYRTYYTSDTKDMVYIQNKSLVDRFDYHF